jgi:hypothetical protein
MAKPSDRARLFPACLIALLAAGACDQYQRFGENGQSNGPVDPVNFPAANLGARGDRTRPGQGTFTSIKAFAGGMPVGYFAYPIPAATLAADPLRVKDAGRPNPRVPTPTAYAFAPDYRCQGPAKYRYDKRFDELPRDRQANVFTTLPRATYTAGVDATTTYAPVVTELTATAPDGAPLPCQIKSEDALKKSGVRGMASNRYLAWLIIDPAAAVYRFDDMPTDELPGGDQLQKWGWFNGYLLAYLDGGEIPVADVTITEAMVEKTVTRMVPQRLYFPRSPVTVTRTAMDGTKTMSMPAPGVRGAGYDVLQARPGQDGYSPICQVFTYDMGGPAVPSDDDSPEGYMGLRLPADAAAVEMMFGTPEMPADPMRPLRPATPAFIYCLQVE